MTKVTPARVKPIQCADEENAFIRQMRHNMIRPDPETYEKLRRDLPRQSQRAVYEIYLGYVIGRVLRFIFMTIVFPFRAIAWVVVNIQMLTVLYLFVCAAAFILFILYLSYLTYWT